MQLVLKQPWTSIGSDGSAVNPDGPPVAPTRIRATTARSRVCSAAMRGN